MFTGTEHVVDSRAAARNLSARTSLTNFLVLFHEAVRTVLYKTRSSMNLWRPMVWIARDQRRQDRVIGLYGPPDFGKARMSFITDQNQIPGCYERLTSPDRV